MLPAWWSQKMANSLCTGAEAMNICHTRSLCPSIGRILKYSDIDVPREMRLNVYTGFQFRIRMGVKCFPSFLCYWYTLWALLNLFSTQGFCVFATGGKIHKHSASEYWAQSWYPGLFSFYRCSRMTKINMSFTLLVTFNFSRCLSIMDFSLFYSTQMLGMLVFNPFKIAPGSEL